MAYLKAKETFLILCGKNLPVIFVCGFFSDNNIFSDESHVKHNGKFHIKFPRLALTSSVEDDNELCVIKFLKFLLKHAF